MSTIRRFVTLAQGLTTQFLNKVEDPRRTLDLTYENLLTGVEQTNRSLAELIAQGKGFERQIGDLDAKVAKAEADAAAALRAGREDLAREALREKQALAGRGDDLRARLAALQPDIDRLGAYKREQERNVEDFRARKESMKAEYGASKARVLATESMAGMDGRLLGTGDALRRAEEQVAGMRDKADALEGMMDAGLIRNRLSDRSSAGREIDAIAANAAVEDDLARLRAEVAKALPKGSA